MNYIELLIFSVLFGIIPTQNAEGEEVFLVGNKRCITNGSSALAFIKNIQDTAVDDNKVSSFFPKKNTLCNFEKGSDCSQSKKWVIENWSTKSSIDGPINQIVTDRRWEGFSLQKSKRSGGNLIFHPILYLENPTNFVIPLSVRIEKDAHIYLCDGESASESNCYWIMLGSHKGTQSGIRKCREKEVPSQIKSYPNSPCNIVNGLTKVKAALKENTWAHFKISRRKNIFNIFQADSDISFITYEDGISTTFPTNHLIINSRNNEGLWKFHNYDYLYSETESEINEQIGPSIPYNEWCISMFVVMCRSCKLTVRLEYFKPDSDRYPVDYMERNFETQDEKWKEINVFDETKNLEDGYMKLHVYKERNGPSNYEKAFWAIDDVRLCAKKEYRYITTEEAITCQKVGIDRSEIINVDDNVAISEQDSNCLAEEFGQFCVPCQLFGRKDCNGFSYCEITGNNNKICQCTAGYRDKSCDKECEIGFYGHGCSKKCSTHCEVGCCPKNGNCKLGKCKYPYTGVNCDDPPEIIFKEAPTIFDVGEESCQVKVDNFEYEKPSTYVVPEYYMLEYAKDTIQEVDDSRRSRAYQDWNIINKNMKMFNTTPISLKHLEPDTYYRVRATFQEDTNVNRNSYLKSRRFRTGCTYMTEQDISSTTTNITATVTIKWPVNGCKLSRYTYSWNGSIYAPLPEHTINRTWLEAYTNYTIAIRNSLTNRTISKLFETKEGTPSKVRDIKIFSFTDQVNLSWQEPEFERGNIIQYRIRHQYTGSSDSSCTPSYTEPFEENYAIKTSINIRDLKAYSRYSFRIQAITKGGEGAISTFTNRTLELGNLTEHEKTEIISVVPKGNNVTVSLKDIDCSNRNGPIYVKFYLACDIEWCSKIRTYRPKLYSERLILSLSDLFAYSSYTIYMNISRDQKQWIEAGNKTFQTEPSAPNKISELEAYSKDLKRISLRWKAPYPPTGILENYNILYKKNNYYRSEFDKNVKPKACKLWPDYHCASLTSDIWEGYIYEIQISAKNEVPGEHGSFSDSITVEIKKEASKPPYGIRFEWTNNYDLVVFWNHPNVTNGPLTSFDILVQSTTDQKYNVENYPIHSQKDYYLTYNYTVPHSKFQSCTKYRVSLRAHNIFARSIDVQSFVTSPPDIPNTPELTLNATNETITIHFLNTGMYSKTANGKTYIFISKAGEDGDLKDFEKNVRDRKNHTLKNSRIVYHSNNSDLPPFFEIGNQNGSSLDNPPLDPGTNYSVSIFIVNECYDSVRLNQLKKFVGTLADMNKIDTGGDDAGDNEEFKGNGGDKGNNDNGGLWALILVLFIPLVVLGYWWKKKKDASANDLLIPRVASEGEEMPLPKLPSSSTKVNVVKPTVKPKKLSQVVQPLRTSHSKRIRITDFEKYVKDAIESGELERQHNLFPRGLVKPCEYGSLQENKAKNRYKNLIAYDETRVKLNKIRKEEYSDYINANFIDGYRKPRCYIATQGPKNNTLNDFWRMIWQERVKNIVMLANIFENGKKKVEKYWPDINDEIIFDDIRVQHVSTDVFANFEHRIFNVYCREKERKVEQLHFTSWPDHGVPLYSQSLVPFLQRMLKLPYSPQTPMVVHCSAGVGRTGTIILSDMCLRMAASEGSIDFLAHLENMRNQRANLVDNIEQYKLVHLVVLECLFGMRTALPCSEEMCELVESTLKNNGITTQMKYISETQWQDSAMETMLESEEVFPDFPEKDRFQEIVPKHYRVYLSQYPNGDESASYINAVFVDGFRNPGQYIVTQQPMPNTLGDFWRMVLERSCTVIVSLNTIDLKDKTVCKFWPDKGQEMNPVDYITVQHVKTKRLECYKVITVQVQVSLVREDTFTVNIIEMSDWNSNELLPNKIEEFLAFIDAAEAMSRNSQQVIVTCHDGATASGLYSAMTFLIEKMKLEHECDVCLAVRSIRHSRKQFVTSEEQYEFLYRASVTYITGFQPYANFN